MYKQTKAVMKTKYINIGYKMYKKLQWLVILQFQVLWIIVDDK